MRNGCLIVECTDRGQKVTHILIVICKDYFVFITIFFFLIFETCYTSQDGFKQSFSCVHHLSEGIWVHTVLYTFLFEQVLSDAGRCEMSWKGDPGRWESADLDEGSKLRSSKSTQVLLVLAISSPQTLILIIYLE